MIIQEVQKIVVCPNCRTHRVKKLGKPRKKISGRHVGPILITREEDDWQQSYKCEDCFYLFEKDIE